MDSGADLCLALLEQEDEQGLRAATGEREAFIYVAMNRLTARRFARSMRLFGQFQKGNSANFVLTEF